MQKYNKGDKVKTIDYWSNGRGTVIPKGSIVTVISDNGNMVFCDFKGFQALYEYEWLGEVVRDGIKTNSDRIRSMTDEELAEFLDNVFNNVFVGYEFPCEHCTERINCDVCFQDWLQSAAE